MVDEIDEYVASVNRRRQEVLPQTEIDFMHECEKNNDYDNQRYQDDVQILTLISLTESNHLSFTT